MNKDLLKLNNAQVIISDACKFVSMNPSFGLQNLNTIPTRITGNSDNIFTNMNNCKCASGTICTDITDLLTILSLLELVKYSNNNNLIISCS